MCDVPYAHGVRLHLDELLDKRGMTLVALAQEIGLAPKNLSQIKNEHALAIRFSTLGALCRVLKCQPGELITYEERQGGCACSRNP